MKVISLAIRDVKENKEEFLRGLIILSLIIFLSSLSFSVERGTAKKVNEFYVKAGGSSLLISSEEKIPFFEGLEEDISYFSALQHNFTSDVYYLIHSRGDTKEFLGIRANLIAVENNFRLQSDYYVRSDNMKEALVEGLPFTNRTNLRAISEAQEWLNIKSGQEFVRIPLLPSEGSRSPGRNEILLDERMKNFLGINIGEKVRLDLNSDQRDYLGNFKVVGTFKTVGTQGSDKTFWRVYHNDSFFDARPPQAELPGVTPVIINKEDLNRNSGRRILRCESITSRENIYDDLRSRNFDVYEPEIGGHMNIRETVESTEGEFRLLTLSFLIIMILSAFSVGFIWSHNRKRDKRIYKLLGYDGFQAGMFILLSLMLMSLVSSPFILALSLLVSPLTFEIGFQTLILNFVIASSVMFAAGLYESRIEI